MTKEQLAVLDFHRKFQLQIQDKPERVTLSMHNFRGSLIREEGKEYDEAFELHDVADALGDLLYVVYGAAVTYGIDLEPVFDEIHRSNMTKLWTHQEVTDCKEPGLTFIPVYPAGCGVGENKRGWLAKRGDGKVIKSPSYSPANLKAVIEAQL